MPPRWFPNAKEQIAALKVTILGDAIGVGSSIDVEAIKPQKCVLIDPPDLPDGKLECEEP